MHGQGGRRALSKTKTMWLETPAAQVSAQGPCKVQGAPGRQGGIVDKIPSAGSSWLLTDQLAGLLLNHCKYHRYLYSLDAKSLQIQRICIAAMPNDCKSNGICTAAMSNGCKNNGICIAVMPNDCNINGICIDSMLNHCKTNGI